MSLTYQNQRHFNDSKYLFEWIVWYNKWKIAESRLFLTVVIVSTHPLPPSSPALSAGGVEPPTKFSKMGIWQDLHFERGVAEKEEGNFSQGRFAILPTKKTKIWNI